MLSKNIEHIKEIVAMQQGYAKLVGVPERVAVASLVEDAVRMNAGAFSRHGVTLQRQLDESQTIVVDKHKVLQILVNLLRNAKYACEESGKADKQVTVRVASRAGGVGIAVADNGIGIHREHMAKMFTHGFTTKNDGHGFGLHSGALSARELGGSLHVDSAGPGQGATFTLELPERPPENNHE
jgi:C4-dicarboxylate-specific signal transduction histidine kinase